MSTAAGRRKPEPRAASAADGIAPTGPLRVTIVDEELPYPPTSGKRIRTLNLVSRLARRHRITYLCHRNADPAEARRAVEHFGGLGIETIVVDRVVPPKKGPGFYARLAWNLLSPLPYSVASHTSRTLRDAIRRHAIGGEVDLWQCEWTPYAESLRHLEGARTLIMAHNVESLIWRRYHETELHPARRWYIGHQWRKFERFEGRVFRAATRVVTVSEEDATRVREDFRVDRVDVVDNGIDRGYFAAATGARDPRQILFLGSLDWRPNLDAINVLLDQVMPAVRSEEPSVRLRLVGRNPPEALVRRAQDTPGVELHADVPDVRPFLAGSGLMVVPLRIGGGSRLKILEALACGLPVVSTRVGAEGLRLQSGRDLVVVDEVGDLAAALVDVIRRPGRAREMAENGRALVLEQYDWEVLSDRLERAWSECLRVHPGPNAKETFS
jgi:glycosyltransferase involved in cell wall biosynthesis